MSDFQRWFDKLDELATLEDNWNSYGAKKPSALALANVREFLGVLQSHGREPRYVQPSAMGGAGVSLGTSGQPRRVFVEFYNMGTAHALLSDRSTEEMDTMPVQTDRIGYEWFLEQAEKYLGWRGAAEVAL